MYNSLEQALKTKKATVISFQEVDVKGNTRKMIKAKKSNGKKIFSIVQYENGLFSCAV